MALCETAEANPCQSHQPTLACHTAPCVRLCICLFSTPKPTLGFLPRLHAVPACWFVVFQSTTTHIKTQNEKERAAPLRPYLMQTRSPVVLEHCSASLSLTSQRGSIIMTQYTNSHHTHTPGFLFSVSHLQQVDSDCPFLLHLSAVPHFASAFLRGSKPP